MEWIQTKKPVQLEQVSKKVLNNSTFNLPDFGKTLDNLIYGRHLFLHNI